MKLSIGRDSVRVLRMGGERVRRRRGSAAGTRGCGWRRSGKLKRLLFQSDRTLEGLTDSRLGRVVAPKAAGATGSRICGEGGAGNARRHSTRAEDGCSGGGTRSKTLLPLDARQVDVNSNDVVRTATHESERTEPAIPDVEIKQRRRRQRIQLSGLVFELDLPYELKAWLPHRVGGNLRITP